MTVRLLLTVASLLGLAACGAGGSGGLKFDPAETTPTRIFSTDGSIELLLQPTAFSEPVQLTLLNRTEQDKAVPGGAGRSLSFALEVRGQRQPPAATPAPAPAPSDPPATPVEAPPLKPATPLEVTIRGLSGYRAGLSLPLYSFNAAAQRYEQSGSSAQMQADGTTAQLSLSEFGRYALYSLLPREQLPPPPGAPRLLAASTQVRRVDWDQPQGAEVIGVNLYRAAGSGEFTKQNTDPLTASGKVDYLTQPGAYRYRLTTVNSIGLESEPGPELLSPAVEFDLLELRSDSRMRRPTGLAWDSAAERLLVADPQAHRLFTLSGSGGGPVTEHAYYRSGVVMLEPVAVACAPDSRYIYIADAARRRVYVLDSTLGYVGEFGGQGSGPGQFERPVGISAQAERVVVADSELGSLQVFTPLGVYLRTLSVADNGAADSAPTAVFSSAAGQLIAADTTLGNLQFYDAQLGFDSLLNLPVAEGGPLSSPSGLAEDFRRRLYISDTGNRRVVVMDGDSLLFHFGSEGSLAVQLGANYGPAGLAYDPLSGYLYVADPGNRRITVFAS